MDKEKFSKREAISFGWYKTKSNFKILIAILFLQIFISYFSSFISNLSKESDSLFLFLTFYLIILFISLTIRMGIIKITLKIHDNEKPEFKDLVNYYPLFLNYLIASIISGIVIFFGLIFFIIPGIILAIKLFFFSYFIVDKKAGPLEALKKSWQMTKGKKWNLFLFFFLLMLINILGFLCLIIGLFVTIPITLMAIAFVYRKLLTQAEVVQAGQTLL